MLAPGPITVPHRGGGVLRAVESVTAASVVSEMVVALRASYFLWPSTMASMMSTPTSTGQVPGVGLIFLL